MKQEEPIILGELKKEKSSKPIFVFIVFALIIAVAFGLPYIKDYFATSNSGIAKFYNTYIGKYFLDEEPTSITNNVTTTKKITTTTKTVEDSSFSGMLTCEIDNNKYIYYFNKNNLYMIYHELFYNYTNDIDLYMLNLTKSQKKTELINTFENSNSKTEETNSGFKFIATLDLNNLKIEDLSEYNDENYFNLNTNYNTISNNLKSKGYTCS